MKVLTIKDQDRSFDVTCEVSIIAFGCVLMHHGTNVGRVLSVTIFSRRKNFSSLISCVLSNQFT